MEKATQSALKCTPMQRPQPSNWCSPDLVHPARGPSACCTSHPGAWPSSSGGSPSSPGPGLPQLSQQPPCNSLKQRLAGVLQRQRRSRRRRSCRRSQQRSKRLPPAWAAQHGRGQATRSKRQRLRTPRLVGQQCTALGRSRGSMQAPLRRQRSRTRRGAPGRRPLKPALLA